MCIRDSAKSLAPDSLRLSEAAFDAVRQIPVESRVSKQGSQLIWEAAPFILTFGDNLTENPRIPACRPAEIRRAAAWVKNALGKPCGLDSLPRDERDGRTENPVRLADCLRRGDKAEALHRLKAGAGAGPGPVSYTHLDVYKRQGRKCAGVAGWPAAIRPQHHVQPSPSRRRAYLLRASVRRG